MSTQISTSSKFNLNVRDLGQAGLYAFIAAIIGFLGDFLVTWSQTNTFSIDVAQLITGLKFALVTGLAAIVQKFRDSNKIVITNVPTEVIKDIKSPDTVSSVTVNSNSNPLLTVKK